MWRLLTISTQKLKGMMSYRERRNGRIRIHLQKDDDALSMETLHLAEHLFAKLAARACLSANQDYSTNKTTSVRELVPSQRSS